MRTSAESRFYMIVPQYQYEIGTYSTFSLLLCLLLHYIWDFQIVLSLRNHFRIQQSKSQQLKKSFYNLIIKSTKLKPNPYLFINHLKLFNFYKISIKMRKFKNVNKFNSLIILALHCFMWISHNNLIKSSAVLNLNSIIHRE